MTITLVSMTIFLLRFCICNILSKSADFWCLFLNVGEKGINLVKFRDRVGKIPRLFLSIFYIIGFSRFSSLCGNTAEGLTNYDRKGRIHHGIFPNTEAKIE